MYWFAMKSGVATSTGVVPPCVAELYCTMFPTLLLSCPTLMFEALFRKNVRAGDCMAASEMRCMRLSIWLWIPLSMSAMERVEFPRSGFV